MKFVRNKVRAIPFIYLNLFFFTRFSFYAKSFSPLSLIYNIFCCCFSFFLIEQNMEKYLTLSHWTCDRVIHIKDNARESNRWNSYKMQSEISQL